MPLGMKKLKLWKASTTVGNMPGLAPGQPLQPGQPQQQQPVNPAAAAGVGAAAAANPPPAITNPNMLPRRATDIGQPIVINGKEWHPTLIRAYNLKWPKLHNWLLIRFKDEGGIEFKDGQAQQSQDYFFFWAPARLTDRERDHIETLREISETDKQRQLIRERTVIDTPPDFDSVA